MQEKLTVFHQEHQKVRGGGTVCQQTKVSLAYGSLVKSVEKCKNKSFNHGTVNDILDFEAWASFKYFINDRDNYTESIKQIKSLDVLSSYELLRNLASHMLFHRSHS